MHRMNYTSIYIFIACLFSVLGTNMGKSAPYFYQVSTNQATPDTTQIVNSLSIAEEYLDEGKFGIAREKIDSALTLSKEINFEYGIVYSKQALADMLLKEQHYDSAITVLQETLVKYPNTSLLYHIYNLLAVGYNYVGNADSAIVNFNTALDYLHLLPQEKQAKAEISILLNMASSYSKLGDKTNTLKNYLEAINSAEVLNDSTLLSITYNNLGDTFNSYDEYDKAIYYFEKALNIALEANLKTNELRIYNNIGNAYAGINDYDTALQFYEKGLELHKVIRPNTPPFQLIYNIGSLHAQFGNFNKAKAAFEESLEHCIRLNVYQGIYFNYEGLGKLYASVNRYAEATQYYNKALDVALKLNQSFFVLQLRERIYQNYKKVGNYKDALTQLELHKALTDSLSEINSKKALAELESKIELSRQTEINKLLEEKQFQQEQQLALRQWLIIAALVVIVLILLLLIFIIVTNNKQKKLYAALRIKKNELEKINATKDKLFTIVSHDLRSPLASLQGILYLINETDLPKEEIKKLGKKLEPTLQRNVDTMDDLLTWARIQMQGLNIRIKKVDCAPILEEVIQKQIFQWEKKSITIKNNIVAPKEVLVDIDAFKLIFRNLLANSIKFTPENGSITFSATQKEKSIVFSINDTGVGIPKDIQSHLFTELSITQKGTNNEKGHGFGLNLCHEFVNLMNGSITFESEEGVGTTFFIELPTQ